jgi:hypothetical protein
MESKKYNSYHSKWESLGVDRVKADLLQNSFKLVGGPPALREAAWEWVRQKEAEALELITLKPSFYGVSIDLKNTFKCLRKKLTNK